MNLTASIPASRVAVVPPSVWVGSALAAMPLLPILLSGWVGYDDGTMRAGAMIVELVVAAFLGSGVRAAWTESPRALRVAVGVWLAASVVTTATAIHVAPAVFRTAEWAVHLILGTTVWCWLREDAGRAGGLLRALAGGCLALAVWNAWSWCSGVWNGASPDSMSTLPLANIRYVGFYAMAALTLGLGALPEGRRHRAVWLALWTVGWAVLCWTGGRGSLVAALAAAVGWTMVARPGWRTVLALALGITIGAAASLLLPDDGRTMGLARFVQDLAPGDNYSSNRVVVWSFLLDLVAARPLRGLGPDGVAFALVGHTQAHNTAVQAIAEWGVVGGLAFGAMLLGLLAGMARGVWRTVGEGRGAVVAAAAAFWVAASLNGLLDGLFYGAGTLALLAVSAALALAPEAQRPRPVPHAWRGAAVALLMTVAAFHLTSSAARFAGGTPAPDSLRVRVALGPATSFRSTEMLWWGKDWADTDPAAALVMARWGQSHSRMPWNFFDLEADLRTAAGDAAGAEALHHRAGASRRSTFVGLSLRIPALDDASP